MSMWLAANGLATIICSPIAYGLSGLVNPAIESWRVLYLLVGGPVLFGLMSSLVCLPSEPAFCIGGRCPIRKLLLDGSTTERRLLQSIGSESTSRASAIIPGNGIKSGKHLRTFEPICISCSRCSRIFRM